MSYTSMRILAIGDVVPSTRDILRRFSERGWGARYVPSVRDAKDLLHTYDFDVSLSAEALPDGRGYDVGELIAQHARSLFVGVALSETCLWLPVICRGAHVLGKRALNPEMLEAELLGLLSASARENELHNVQEIARKSTHLGARPVLERATLLRRKYRDRHSLPM